MHKNQLRLALATATAAALTGGLLGLSVGAASAADSTTVPHADFNGDGRGDVAFSAHGAYVGGKKEAGQLVVLYGTTTGVSSAKRHTISQNTTGAPGTAEAGDRFGYDTAFADFNGDGYDDIVSGAAWNATTGDGTAIPDSAKGGKVWVTYGTASGPGTATGITQDTGNVPGGSETNDMFGYELDLGDINGDNYLDLAIGVAGEDFGSAVNTGAVTILYGGASGLNTTSGAQSLAQSTAGVPGNDENNDMFGMDVKLDDVTGDGKADLIAGSAENDGNGGVTYLPSNGSKITTSGSRTIAPSTSGVSTTGTPYFGANFAD